MTDDAQPLSFRILLVISLAALGVAIFLLFYLRSRHPFVRIPIWRILLFFLYGAFAAPIMVFIGYILFASPELEEDTALAAFLFIGPVEELAKFAGPFVLVGLIRRWREEPFEWMMAGASAGTGFAMTENILYAFFSADMFEVLALRSVAPMHLLWSAWLGYRIGRRRPGPAGLILASLIGFAIAAFLHGLWDALCFSGLIGLLVLLFGGQLFAFGWQVRKMTWLCANRSPARPEAPTDAERIAPTGSGTYRCPTCDVPAGLLSLKDVELYICPACNRTAIGRGDLHRFVNAYAGTSGWFPLETWYGYYWQKPEGGVPIPCVGCGASLTPKRFLHEEGVPVGFCDDCALATGDRKEILELPERFRSRIENGFLYD